MVALVEELAERIDRLENDGGPNHHAHNQGNWAVPLLPHFVRFGAEERNEDVVGLVAGL